MAYKGKPLIVATRPWWRHPIFPWGWYSIKQEPIEGALIYADGYHKPGDGGGGLFSFVKLEATDNS